MVNAMRKAIFILLSVCALFFFSCERTSQPRFDGEVYSLAGLLVAGERIDLEHPVYVTRSASIEEFDPMQIFVGDAEVTVRDLGTSQIITLSKVTDLFQIKYIDISNQIIQAGHSYRIEVNVPGYNKLIWAETTVPQAVALVPDVFGTNPAGEGYSFDPDTQNTIQFSRIDAEFPLALNTYSTAGSYNFAAEFFCLEEFSTDLEFTTPVFGIEHPDASMEEMYYSGGETIRRIEMLGRFSSAPQAGLEGNYILLRDYGYIYVFYGRYRVKTYILDDNYYSYAYMPEGYLHGGVNNALGYFGSASGGELYTTIVK